MIATGSYAAKASGPLEFVKSPEKGTPGVQVTLELKAGPNTGERITWIGWLTDSTTSRTGESLSLMGYDGRTAESVMQKEIVAVIEHEQYTNKAGEPKTRARVAWINDPTAGGRMDPMSSAEVAGAQQRLAAAVTAAKAKAGKASNSDDDVKF